LSPASAANPISRRRWYSVVGLTNLFARALMTMTAPTYILTNTPGISKARYVITTEIATATTPVPAMRANAFVASVITTLARNVCVLR
jgi:hypothetical protein